MSGKSQNNVTPSYPRPNRKKGIASKRPDGGGGISPPSRTSKLKKPRPPCPQYPLFPVSLRWKGGGRREQQGPRRITWPLLPMMNWTDERVTRDGKDRKGTTQIMRSKLRQALIVLQSRAQTRFFQSPMTGTLAKVLESPPLRKKGKCRGRDSNYKRPLGLLPNRTGRGGY